MYRFISHELYYKNSEELGAVSFHYHQFTDGDLITNLNGEVAHPNGSSIVNRTQT